MVERELEGQKISAERRNFALSRKFCVRASDPMHHVSENFIALIAFGASALFGHSARLTVYYLIRDARWGWDIKRIDTATIKVINAPKLP